MSDPKKSEEGTQTIPETMTDLLSGEEEGAQCLEKRVYYKIVSGEFLLSSYGEGGRGKTMELMKVCG